MLSIWKNLINDIKREKLLSISNIAVMTVTFLVLGIFINVIVLSQTAIRHLENQAQVTVFFEDWVTEEAILQAKSGLEEDHRVSEIKYVSKAEAFEFFIEVNKDEPILLESITEDILPASLEIKTIDVADLSDMTDIVSQIDGVEDVRFFENVVDRLVYWSRVIYIVGFSLLFIFMVISYSVVIAALRTTINSKGKEYEIMKLVGGSNSYVKLPLIYQGVFFGVVSALIAGFLMLAVGFSFAKLNVVAGGYSLGFLPGIYIKPVIFSLILGFVLVLSGVLLGYLGSNAAVKKYLKY